MSQNGSAKRSHPAAQIQPEFANWTQQPPRIPSYIEACLWRAGVGRHRHGEHHRHGARHKCTKELFKGRYPPGLPRIWSSIGTIQGCISILPWETRESHAWVLHRNCRREKRLIDATLEPYTCHPGRSCFGRPCNHVNENDLRCNMRMVEIQADKIDGLKERWRRVVFVARRDIKPMEQLMFDYGDINARRIFWKNELSSIS